MNNETGGSIVERGEYKGNPLIILKRNEEDKYPFSFGINKARLIVDNLEETSFCGLGSALPCPIKSYLKNINRFYEKD